MLYLDDSTSEWPTRYLSVCSLILAFICIVPNCNCQILPNWKELFGSNNFRTLQYVEDVNTDIVGLGSLVPSTTIRTVVTYERAGKIRIEAVDPDGATLNLIVSDGHSTWNYVPEIKQYTRATGSVPGLRSAANSWLRLGTHIESLLKDARPREETVAIGGVERDCWVVVVTMQHATSGASPTDQVATIYFDRKTMLDVKVVVAAKIHRPGAEITMTQTFVKRDIMVDAPIVSSLFKFVAPPGANLVSTLTYPELAPPQTGARPLGVAAPTRLVGTQAPAFNAKGLDGNVYSLEDYKGKLILLEFWATWCIPCRESAPILKSLHAEYEEKGLVVFAVSDEEQSVVASFLDKMPFPYPVLLDVDSGISEGYSISAYPTFILIGRDGTVIGYLAGFSGEQPLRALLEKGGLGSSGTK